MKEARPSSDHRHCFGPAASFGALRWIISTSIKHSSLPRNGYQTHLPHLSLPSLKGRFYLATVTFLGSQSGKILMPLRGKK